MIFFSLCLFLSGNHSPSSFSPLSYTHSLSFCLSIFASHSFSVFLWFIVLHLLSFYHFVSFFFFVFIPSLPSFSSLSSTHYLSLSLLLSVSHSLFVLLWFFVSQALFLTLSSDSFSIYFCFSYPHNFLALSLSVTHYLCLSFRFLYHFCHSQFCAHSLSLFVSFCLPFSLPFVSFCHFLLRIHTPFFLVSLSLSLYFLFLCFSLSHLFTFSLCPLSVSNSVSVSFLHVFFFLSRKKNDVKTESVFVHDPMIFFPSIFLWHSSFLL